MLVTRLLTNAEVAQEHFAATTTLSLSLSFSLFLSQNLTCLLPLLSSPTAFEHACTTAMCSLSVVISTRFDSRKDSLRPSSSSAGRSKAATSVTTSLNFSSLGV